MVNAAMDEIALDVHAAGQALLDEAGAAVRRTLGTAHPLMRAVAEKQRLECDIAPPPS